MLLRSGILLVVLLTCLTLSFAATSIQKLQSMVTTLIEEQGFQTPELGDLLERILSLDYSNFVALGTLALHHMHLTQYDECLGFLAQLKVAPTASQLTRNLAGNISTAVAEIQHGNMFVAIAVMRRISATLSLLHYRDKHPLHRAIQKEMLEFAHSFDIALVKQQKARQTMPENYVPGLSTRSFWPSTEFTLARDLEHSASLIAEEVIALRGKSTLWHAVGDHTVRTDTEVLRAGNWSDVLLFKMGRFQKDVCESLPATCALIGRHRSITANPMGLALISELSPGTEVTEHLGYSNARITFHLALRVPAEDVAGIRVGDSENHWQTHKVLVFDDSLPHSVWHRGSNTSGPRTVLLLRAWHPEVAIEEQQAALHDLVREGEDWRETDIERALGESVRLSPSRNVSHGCMAGNCKQGNGTYMWAHGSRYKGEFFGGQPHGHGSLFYATGAKYEGAFRDGLRHGIGKHLTRKKSCYAGEFQDNFPHGKGAIWQQGKHYAGTFEVGIPHGRGVMKWGVSQFEGQMFHGMAHGVGRQLSPGGESYVGQWAHDSFDGCGKHIYRWLFFLSAARHGFWRNSILHAPCTETTCCNLEVEHALREAEQARRDAENGKLLGISAGYTCEKGSLALHSSLVDL